MRFEIITIFPEFFENIFSYSIIKRAIEKKLIEINVYNLRDFTLDKHKTVDDKPFGGGCGMVFKPEPIFRAVEFIKEKRGENLRIILLSPQGKLFNQEKAKELSKYKNLVLICGHYEGVDERVVRYLVEEEISIGDYILTGGEIPALVIIDCVSRILPGVLGKEDSLKEESFSRGILEYPQYTRPRKFRNFSVPEVLLSGDHKTIEKWRLKEALRNTYKKRPELLKEEKLTEYEKKLLLEIKEEEICQH
jgi:tRNA (guanine37-N1)-methyltransferase